MFVVDDIEMRLENLAVYDGEINMHSERENDYMYLIEFNVNNQSDDSIPFSNSDLKAYDEEGYQLERILVSSNNNAGLDTINTMGALDAGRQIKLYVVLDAKTGEDIEVTWDKTVSFRSEKAEFVLPALQ
ncbi:hypothetical protein JOC54_003237 [Alkalihalobacillus xiaoxiensis]|uniref:DUF4352 domain-containing protein n=1 Tax=Shouchella xiaoxiensis TaxID=766895 RepID=A0ABS2SWP3_9BACI|nr:hypothetical protein [Shouchella xiaoxiensis]MBM7839957.1 hypothetical protein [Shouchella xiaoxiensis]